jgi:hypothetical protein
MRGKKLDPNASLHCKLEWIFFVYLTFLFMAWWKLPLENRNMWPPCFWQTGYIYWNTTIIIFWNLNHIGGPQKYSLFVCSFVWPWQARLTCTLGDHSSKLVPTPGMLSQGSVVLVRSSKQVFGQSSGPQPHPVPVPSDTKQSVACSLLQLSRYAGRPVCWENQLGV